MKADLKRIETTLHQLAEQSHANGHAVSTSWENQKSSLEGRSQKLGSEHSPFFSMRVSALPAPRHHGKTPMLPKFKAPSFSNHRHAANPALAMNLLQEIEAIVDGWQQEL